MKAKDRIIVALDVDTPLVALNLVNQLKKHVGLFKIGLEFINSMLASLITPKNESDALGNLKIIRLLFSLLKGKIFWDGKFDDIPNTVRGATIPVAQRIKVKMFNFHASAGPEAIAKAVANKGKALALGVTVLTSLDKECKPIFGADLGDKVLQFAGMLKDQGADGVICSPKELEVLRMRSRLNELLMVTPGVRPDWAAKGDQKRVMTPAEAIKAGADYLVIGRPITQPPEEIGDSVEAAKTIAEEIASVL